VALSGMRLCQTAGHIEFGRESWRPDLILAAGNATGGGPHKQKHIAVMQINRHTKQKPNAAMQVDRHTRRNAAMQVQSRSTLHMNVRYDGQRRWPCALEDRTDVVVAKGGADTTGDCCRGISRLTSGRDVEYLYAGTWPRRGRY